jgi:hypothetical protein
MKRLFLIILFSGFLISGCTTSIECGEGEAPLKKCSFKKEITYDCIPDPDDCYSRLLDNCEYDGKCYAVTYSGTCGCPQCEIMRFNCYPISNK